MDKKFRVKNIGMGYSNNAAAKSKNKHKDSADNGGKVTQFKNIDDIPNMNEEDLSWDSSSSQYNEEQVGNLSSLQYSQNGNCGPQFASNKKGVQLASHQNYPYVYESEISQQRNNFEESIPEKGCFQAENNFQHSYVNNNNQPTNHVQHQSNERDLRFDEHEEEEFSSEEDSPLPAPPREDHNKYVVSNGKPDKKFGAKPLNNVSSAAPPLPCDMKKELSGKDKLFFSKEPRPVDFK